MQLYFKSYEDEICQLNDNSPGICKHLYNCPLAVKNLLEKKERPKTCGFEGAIPIVCCNDSNGTLAIQQNAENSEFGKVSAKMCKTYSSLVFQNVSSPTLIPNVLFDIVDTCAIKKEKNEDNTVLAREFPHLVSQLGAAKYVRVGSTLPRENYYHEKPLQWFQIQEFIKHPDYDEAKLSSNIALIKLNGHVTFNSIVRPACLSTTHYEREDAINVGWGTLNRPTYMNNEPLKNILKVVNPSNCNLQEQHQFCVAQLTNNMWQNCLVDQGSALQIYNKDKYCMYDIIGVLSSWNTCHSQGIYTNVTMFVPWIEKTVWSAEFK
ncbi:eg:bacr7a4.3 protein-related [Holotrichia oblita]|uniref:Eg:bacr7a4.3 protein-related n=1 Tax=Holotrichia oblita TaxID=644536 RepID=A0ACB9SXY7_HOLOL|nr:eg:bacr7a4.3 protein-related [Holotrichia oblita]